MPHTSMAKVLACLGNQTFRNKCNGTTNKVVAVSVDAKIKNKKSS
jgi:hypothetical protein